MESNISPRWSSVTKLVVALTAIAGVIGLVIHFNTLVGPLLMSFIVAYLFYPAAGWLAARLHLAWRVAVIGVYAALIVIVLGLITAGGVALVQQVQSLIDLFDTTITSLPDTIQQIASQTWALGPFKIDLTQLDLPTISRQALSAVQPFLSRTGEMVSAVAGGAFNTVSWTIFVFTISFFILFESDGLGGFMNVEIPRYSEDVRRLGAGLTNIWNTFLRGQLIIFAMTVAIYTVIYNLFGLRYAIGLALLTGFSKFLPYIGQGINMIALVIVAIFQAHHPFGLDPLPYAALVLIAYILIDGTYDNAVVTPLMARTLKVHPAAVLVALLVAADLLGLIGVIIAAPMLATLLLVGRYVTRKMLDLDPWPPEPPLPPEPTLRERLLALRDKARGLFRKK
jgi:predicted PurR-regulated permease PerM